MSAAAAAASAQLLVSDLLVCYWLWCVQLFRPKILICGASAYPRDFDYVRLRKVADAVGAFLMCDMAHVSGLVAAGELKSPFEHCHIVTTTTHKSLRGPRAGMIFFRRDPPKGAKGSDGKELERFNFEARINDSVFPSLQGGPHNNTIAAIAVQLKEVDTKEFKDYAKQVIANAQQLVSHSLPSTPIHSPRPLLIVSAHVLTSSSPL